MSRKLLTPLMLVGGGSFEITSIFALSTSSPNTGYLVSKHNSFFDHKEHFSQLRFIVFIIAIEVDRVFRIVLLIIRVIWWIIGFTLLDEYIYHMPHYDIAVVGMSSSCKIRTYTAAAFRTSGFICVEHDKRFYNIAHLTIMDHSNFRAFPSYQAKHWLEDSFHVKRKARFLQGVGRKELGKESANESVPSSSHVLIVPSLSSSSHVFASPGLIVKQY
ncbi:hypothetical protein Tco_0583038 [Tanacetum coccineum]